MTGKYLVGKNEIALGYELNSAKNHLLMRNLHYYLLPLYVFLQANQKIIVSVICQNT